MSHARPLTLRPKAALALIASVAAFAVSASALAAVPSLELASERQASLRQAAAGKSVDVTVTVTAGKLANYSEPGVTLGADKALEFGEAKLAWQVVTALLTSEAPITDLQAHTGALDASKTRIATLDGEFVYVWGSSPTIALSRDLARIRRVHARAGEHTWEFRLSGDLGFGGLPERIYVLRSGEPFASVALEAAASDKD